MYFCKLGRRLVLYDPHFLKKTYKWCYKGRICSLPTVTNLSKRGGKFFPPLLNGELDLCYLASVEVEECKQCLHCSIGVQLCYYLVATMCFCIHFSLLAKMNKQTITMIISVYWLYSNKTGSELSLCSRLTYCIDCFGFPLGKYKR